MKKVNEKETTQSLEKEDDNPYLDRILELESRCSEAIGIRKNEPSHELNKSWQRTAKEKFPNLYDTPTTIFKTFGNSSTIGQLSGLAGKGIRTAFFSSDVRTPLNYYDSQKMPPFVVHLFNFSGINVPTPNFFQLVPGSVQQAVDFTLIAHYLAEKSLCPGVVIHEFVEYVQDEVRVPNLEEMMEFLGLPDDVIETPASSQEKYFGKKRPRIPGHFSEGNLQLNQDVHDLCNDALNKFAQLTKRSYNSVDQMNAKEADFIIVASGRSYSWLAQNLSKLNKNRNSKIGLVNPALIAPFPGGVISNIIKGKKQVVAVSNSNNSDYNPLVMGIKNSVDKALENGRHGSKASMPYLDHAIFSKLADRPQLITFSTHGGKFDPRAFKEALKNLEGGAPAKWHFDIGVEIQSEEDSSKQKAQDIPKESKRTLEEISFKEEGEAEEEPKISSGDNFRQLLSYFVTGKAPHSNMEPYIGLGLKPVIFSLHEDEQDKTFPICFIKNSSSEKFVKPLPEIFNEIVNEEPENEEAKEQYKTDLSALRSRMESMVNGRKTGRLTELWDSATKSILAEIREDEEKRKTVQKNLQEGRKKLKAEGDVFSFSADFHQKVIQESLSLAWTEKSASFRDELNRIISQLYDLLGIDPSKESGGDEEDFGTSVASAFRDELDFESFSRVVKESFEQEPLPKNRRTRIQGIIKSLKALQPLYSARMLTDQDDKSILSLFQLHCDLGSCAVTIGQFQARIRSIIKFFRALHMAKLEVQNKFKEEKHQQFFDEFTVNHLSADDLKLVPPMLLHVSLDDLDETGLAAIMDFLSTDLPIKIILQTDDVLDKSDLLPDQINWSTKFSTMAIAFNNVYVFQSAIADGEQFANGILQGLKYDGPALFNIFISAEENLSSIPLKKISTTAMETRAFPTLIYDPSKSEDWGLRFSISDNSQFEKDWATREFTYQDSGGKDVSIELALTLVDFLGADKRFASHFMKVPRNRWHGNMIPLQDYLKLKQEEAKFKLPYLLVNGEDGNLHRVIPTRFLVGLALGWLEVWRSLQELGLYEEEKEQLREKKKAEIADVEEKYQKEQAKSEKELKTEIISNLLTRLLGGDIKAPGDVATLPVEGKEAAAKTADAAEKPAEDTEEAAEEVAEISEPYIDTPLCTSCNECTNINNRMFAYNENKQAYIKDASAGTFKELVKAAEKCPARIIHPGKPKNPDEPGLDKLIKRAERFN